MTNQTNVHDYESAAQYLETGRDKTDRPLEYETRLQRRNENEIAVRFYWTDVVTYHADGSVTLDSGGWHTATTKKRMNDYQSVAYVYQEDWEWFIRLGDWRNGETVPYHDPVTIEPDGTVRE